MRRTFTWNVLEKIQKIDKEAETLESENILFEMVERDFC